jgi:hypothetical protein
MAKYQYIISSDGNWQSMFGHALLAISNTSGSGRKMTMRSLNIDVNSIFGATQAQVCKATLYKGSVINSGEDMSQSVTKMDSTNTLPSTVKVKRYSAIDTLNNPMRAYTASRFGAAAGTQNTLNNHKPYGKYGGALFRSAMKGTESIVESIYVRQNESVALICNTVQASSPLKVSVTVSIDSKTYIWSYFVNTLSGLSLFSLENSGLSVVKIISIGIQEVGTTDTPYLRLVPIGQVYNSYDKDSSNQNIAITKMDSSSPTLTSSTCKIYSDIGFIPLGVPESYIAEGSIGTPKGFSYLHTKDFNGPTLKVFFPEMEKNKPFGVNEDMLGYGYSFKNTDIGILGAGIVINPGEGLALVASAETAVGVQASYSGWTSLKFTAIFDVEPQTSPYLNLTNIVYGSDVVILIAGTTVELTSVDSIGSTTFSWNYDPDLVTSVDICLYKTGYIPYTIRTVSLGLSGTSIPIGQRQDRNYY